MEEPLITHHPMKTVESIPPESTSKHAVEDVITAIAFISVFSLLLLPYKKIDGNPIPTVIFNNLPSYFHALVLCLNFAFCGGVMTISLRHIYPRVACLCRCVCVVSMLLAAGILLALAVPWAADTA